MKIELVITADGSHTIFIPEMNEQFHSMNGAITESTHVYIESGFMHSSSSKPLVFEVGFGTGLNVLLTAIQAKKIKKHCTYYTIEKYPLQKDMIDTLNYRKIISEENQSVFDKIHECDWNKKIKINTHFSICKIQGNLETYALNELPGFDVIYFDAFGPDKQPEMWTQAIFEKLAANTNANGIIVTYSAKGEVRRILNRVGFDMERLPGPPGKKQMLRGIKRDSFT